MPDTGDLEDALRSLAADLDARSRPTTPAAAMARTAPIRRPRPRTGRIAVGVLAAVVLAVVVASAGLARGGDDPVQTDQVPEPTPPPTATVPPTSGTVPRPTIALEGTALADLPAAGFADVTDGGVVLLSFDGAELARATGWPGGVPAPGTDLIVRDDRGTTVVEEAPPDPAQVPEGECESAAGAGGIRVGICAGGTEVDLVGPDGTLAPLVDMQSDTVTLTRALPSPDGRSVLVEYADDCGMTSTLVVGADPAGAGTSLTPGRDSIDQVAVGWLPDGRAVVQVLGSGCQASGMQPMVVAIDPDAADTSLLDPGGLDATLPIQPQGVLHMWTQVGGGLNDEDRTLQRAARELGLQRCCDGPLAGADVNAGVVWEGTRVTVATSDQATWPPADMQDMHTVEVDGVDILVGQRAGGTVATFLCKNTWVIGGEPLDVTGEATVVAVAEALIPHLYCTVDAP